MKCPYYEKRNKSCTHKGCKLNRKSKRLCGFKNIINCPLFLEWMEFHTLNKEKSQEGALKSKLNTLDN